MPSRNVGKKRRVGNDPEVPAELARREAQDRPKPSERQGGARSPVDAMHVDAPKKKEGKKR